MPPGKTRSRPRRQPEADAGSIARGAKLRSESGAGVAVVERRVVSAPAPDHLQRPARVDVEVVDERVEAGTFLLRIVRVASQHHERAAAVSSNVVGACAWNRTLQPRGNCRGVLRDGAEIRGCETR